MSPDAAISCSTYSWDPGRRSWQPTGRDGASVDSTSIRPMSMSLSNAGLRGRVLNRGWRGPHHERQFWIEEDAEPWLVRQGALRQSWRPPDRFACPTAFRFGDIN